METLEDRVFGRPETYPPLPLQAHPSTTMDLFSVQVEGAEVRYAAEGTTAHPPLVFLHGWGASHKFWRHAFTAFSPRYRCLAPDLVGFGISEKPDRDYSMEALAVWVGSFLDALGIGRVTLVAHSMGGTVALLFALDQPERLERLVVVNPLIQGSTAFTRRTRFLMRPVIRFLAFEMSRWRWLRRWVTKEFSYVQRLDDALAADIAQPSYRSATRSMLSLARTDLRPRLPSLAVPTLAIGTDMDRVVAPGQHEWVPAVEKVRIPHTGHIPMVERPHEFNRILDAFLKKTAEAQRR